MTVVLMTAMIVGAGTDYAVFLISRYHEYLRSGVDSDEAVQRALESIGKVIAASAATVAVTFCGMVFTRLPAFTSVGPGACGFDRRGVPGRGHAAARHSRAGGPPRMGRAPGAADRPLWQRSAIQIVRRPKAHLLVSLRCPDRARRLRTDDAPDLQRPHAVARLSGEQPGLLRDGGALLDECAAAGVHLHPITARSENSQALADMEQMAQRVAQLPTSPRCAESPARRDSHWIRPRSATRRARSVRSSRSVVTDQQQDKRSRCAQRWRPAAGRQPGRCSRPGPYAGHSMTAMTGTLNKVQQQLASTANRTGARHHPVVCERPDRGRRRGQQCEARC